VGEKLGLKPASLQLFGLFEGPLGAPCSVLADDSTVPPDAKLCFQRWNMELDREAKLSRQDDAALHLLFAEARFNVDQGNMTPSAEQAVALESLVDPAFPTERQYLELARGLPGYETHVAKGVVVEGDITSNDVQIPSGAVVTCLVGKEGLTLKTREGERSSWGWELVKRWRTHSSRQLHYEVCMMQTNAPILSWIQLCTPQAYFLGAASEMLCRHLHNQARPTGTRVQQ
jgi:hypothetical protein